MSRRLLPFLLLSLVGCDAGGQTAITLQTPLSGGVVIIDETEAALVPSDGCTTGSATCSIAELVITPAITTNLFPVFVDDGTTAAEIPARWPTDAGAPVARLDLTLWAATDDGSCYLAADYVVGAERSSYVDHIGVSFEPCGTF